MSSLNNNPKKLGQFPLSKQNEFDRLLVRAVSMLSEKKFNDVWDNVEDAEYDKLEG